MLYIKVCRCQDSNHGPVELEATALPTEPEPLKYFVNSCFEIYNSLRVLEDFSMELAPHWLCVVSCGGRGVRLGHEKTWNRDRFGKSSLYLYGVYVTKVCLGWSKRNGGYEIGVGKEAAVWPDEIFKYQIWPFTTVNICPIAIKFLPK